MTATRTFHIGDVLSITDGHLVSPRHIQGVYEILNWMTGESLFTHQLPRASRECRPSLVEQFPDLAAVVFPSELRGDEAAIFAWLEAAVALYGETREVAPLAIEDHTPIDPIAELKMMRPGSPIIEVRL